LLIVALGVAPWAVEDTGAQSAKKAARAAQAPVPNPALDPATVINAIPPTAGVPGVPGVPSVPTVPGRSDGNPYPETYRGTTTNGKSSPTYADYQHIPPKPATASTSTPAAPAKAAPAAAPVAAKAPAHTSSSAYQRETSATQRTVQPARSRRYGKWEG
jgi:hypothetical protein